MSRRILVVQTAFLGDIVLTTPLLRALKRAHPGSTTTLVTTPLGKALLTGHPDVDEIVVHDKRGKDKGVGGVLRAIRALHASKFDIAIAAQRSARTGLLVRGSGAPLRIGFEKAAGSWAYTDRVPWRKDEHALKRYLVLATPAGGDPRTADSTPSLPVRDEARAKVDALLEAQGIAASEPILAVAPGSIWGTKRWTPQGFAEVIRAAPGLGLRPVLTGSPDEEPLCRDVAALAGGHVPVLAGTTGLPELVALIARAKALVCGDSGPGHVASAVGTPVVAIFGPTVPAFGYTPWGERNVIVERLGLECRPCDAHGPQVCPLGHHRCMTEIGAADVLAAVAPVAQRAL
ncbi:MAG TPA: lipopolysaccharide heptosyltransferase II [Candidatus Polarisedimenticolaceae bacterium]|nr:lipopolysaccharide heptosyltransferase II [Candidatus Polarisedimenticolaceae bacterium]